MVSIKKSLGRVRWIHHLSYDEHVSCYIYLLIQLNTLEYCVTREVLIFERYFIFLVSAVLSLCMRKI